MRKSVSEDNDDNDLDRKIEGAACRKSAGAPASCGQIIQLPINQLTLAKRNARTHDRRQIHSLAASIDQYGFNNPILVDKDGAVVAGHARLKAAKLLGLEEVPTSQLSHLSADQLRAYAIADNRLAELAGWDRETLALELDYLIDLDIDIEPIGFEAGEVDLILADHDEEKDETAGAPEDQSPEPDAGPAVSRTGDLWLLGKHKILCGDAREDAAYQRVLGDELAQYVISDPPFNVAVNGHACRGETLPHREFAMATGEMTEEGFTEFLGTIFVHLVDHSVDGSIHAIFMDWRHLAEMMKAGSKAYSELKNLVVWSKTWAGTGYFYRSRHELVFLWKSGKLDHINNIGAGRNGHTRSNVWDYAPVRNTAGKQGEEVGWHPTVKPVALIADAIKDCSRRHGIVLDPFLGSGTTLIAAQQTGRRARGIEIDPAYVDVAIKRWQQYTGKAATLATTGQTFVEVKDLRADPGTAKAAHNDDLPLKEAA